jgi:hypothetical protein
MTTHLQLFNRKIGIEGVDSNPSFEKKFVFHNRIQKSTPQTSSISRMKSKLLGPIGFSMLPLKNKVTFSEAIEDFFACHNPSLGFPKQEHSASPMFKIRLPMKVRLVSYRLIPISVLLGLEKNGVALLFVFVF